jgi:hypothetical protein
VAVRPARKARVAPNSEGGRARGKEDLVTVSIDDDRFCVRDDRVVVVLPVVEIYGDWCPIIVVRLPWAEERGIIFANEQLPMRAVEDPRMADRNIDMNANLRGRRNSCNNGERRNDGKYCGAHFNLQ